MLDLSGPIPNDLSPATTRRCSWRRCRLRLQSVGRWRSRFHRYGLAGLSDAPRSGRPRPHDDDRVATLLRTVLAAKPTAGTHWSVRTVAEQTGISKSTVQRYLTLFGVQPHRTRSFTLSTDPLFVEKVHYIVGLYLNPPDHALNRFCQSISQFPRVSGKGRAGPQRRMITVGPKRAGDVLGPAHEQATEHHVAALGDTGGARAARVMADSGYLSILLVCRVLFGIPSYAFHPVPCGEGVPAKEAVTLCAVIVPNVFGSLEGSGTAVGLLSDHFSFIWLDGD
jgi:AraC-like DNA-binding protein